MPGKRTDALTIQGIIDLHKAGYSTKEISQQKGVKLGTLQSLIKRFEDYGCLRPAHIEWRRPGGKQDFLPKDYGL